MIERPEIPPVRVVAVMAFPTKCFVVNVLFFMASETADFSILVGGTEVTFFASNGAVLTYQGEPNQVVVEKHAYAPSGLVVTFLTSQSFLLIVNVVVPVTFNAIGLWVFDGG